MKCKNVRNYMEEYIDGAITGATKDELERHLENCADCRQVLMERQRWGEMLSGSLKEISRHQEPSPELVKSASTAAGKAALKPRQPSIPLLRPRIAWSKLAAVGLLPLIALVLSIVLLQKHHDQNRMPGLHQPVPISYMKLTITHFAGNSPDAWITKKVHIQTGNSENGSLTLELTKQM